MMSVIDPVQSRYHEGINYRFRAELLSVHSCWSFHCCPGPCSWTPSITHDTLQRQVFWRQRPHSVTRQRYEKLWLEHNRKVTRNPILYTRGA